MIYFEEEFVYIKTKASIAILEWRKFAKTDEYRLSLDQFFKLIEEQKNTLWLFNFKRAKVIDMQNQKWTTDVWLPKILQVLDNNLSKLAIIPSQDIFNKVAVRMITNKMSQMTDFDLAFFDSVDQATMWLESADVEETPEEV